MKSLDDYEVISIIGKGTIGTCSKVRNKNTSEIHAWKAIDYDEFSETREATLASEIQLLQQLKHTNIVQYFDHFINVETKTIFILMEFCDGGNLGNLIAKCHKEQLQFEEKYIWRVLYQLCKALKFCHDKIPNGFVLHRDIKPSNVFLDIQGNIKLGDFGLVRNYNEESFAGMFCGQKYDSKSDVWIVGCVIYEMCALKTAIKGQKFGQLSQNISNDQYNCIPEVYTKDLQEIISFMLDVDSEQRPNVENILNHPVLVRNILMNLNDYEYPNLISSKLSNESIKNLEFSPNLSSTVLKHFSIDPDGSSCDELSGVNTSILRMELFGSVKRKLLTNSNPELNKTSSNDDDDGQPTDIQPTSRTKHLINYCPEDPEILTRNIFDNELKRRLQSIRAQESLLKQRTENLLTKERQLNEREKRISETEKQLEERQLNFDELLKKNALERQTKLLPPKRPISKSFDDSYCSIESNDAIIIPTVAKLDLASMPPPKHLPRKTVTFRSPKKLIKYNIENNLPTQNGLSQRPLSLRVSKKELQKNNKENLRSSLSSKSSCSEDSEQITKRKSILSIFGFHNKWNNKDNKKDKNENQNELKTNQFQDFNDKKVLDSFDSTNLTRKWTVENKKAAFELLAAMNAVENKKLPIESKENQLNTMTQNYQKSTKDKTVLQRSRQRRSMMAWNTGQNRLM